jgi:phosphopantothenoylcysteine synthetase/decarboxylase
MNVLVTAGNTLVFIDRVRAITNIFTGRTGAAIAREAHCRAHAVTLLTSHPEAVTLGGPAPCDERWSLDHYRTFDELEDKLALGVRHGGFDGIIHCAAVSDYRPAGIFAPAPGTRFEQDHWEGAPPRLTDVTAAKVKSDVPELWLRLERAPKLIDRFRTEWDFRGLLVKFKLEVGVSDEELLQVAERSRQQSAADLMTANTLEGAAQWAYVGPVEGAYRRVSRRELPECLLDAMEKLHREKTRG